MAEEKPKKQEIKLAEIPTQHVRGYEFPDGTVVAEDGLLLWMANKILRIDTAVA